MAVGISFSAQATAADIEGVVGMNFSTIDQSGVGFRPGFHAGVRATFYIPDVVQGFYVNGAALLSLKGYKLNSYENVANDVEKTLVQFLNTCPVAPAEKPAEK